MKKIHILALLTALILLTAGTNLMAAEKSNAQIYFDNLLQGDYDKCFAMSTTEMQEAMSAELLRETWESVPKQVGEFIEVIQTTTEQRDPFTVYTFAVDFDKMVLDVLVTQDENGSVAGLLFRPSSVAKPGVKIELPEYLKAENIVEQDYTFELEGLNLNGKLTLPSREGSFPLVLMLSGSGPNDMDETVGARKPFRDLAYGLARQGIASLRWTKRTRDYPESLGDLKYFTVRDEYLPEVNAALTALEKIPHFIADGYYLLGHSLGGFILPMAASELKEITGFIMLAGNARPLEDLVLEQYTYIYGLEEMTPEIQETLDTIKSQVNDVKYLDEEKPAPENLLMGLSKAYWLSLNQYDQVETFSKTQQPFLILQGEKDYQVTMEDFKLWTQASEVQKNAELRSYPDLDHLFMHIEGMSTPGSYMAQAFVAEQVIHDIADWIRRKE
ncbi:MAG: DUF3887 domain-containing protein [Candidatus Cloacimonadaceae bacterium]